MLGRTHFFIGISAALAVMQPSSMSTLVAGAGAAAIGGMISDIDSGTSQAHKEADKIMTAAIAITAVIIFADCKFHVGIYERLMRNSSIARLLIGAMAFIIICTYGSGQPHRSFMHSFLSMFMLTACMDVIYPDASQGLINHLLLSAGMVCVVLELVTSIPARGLAERIVSFLPF